MDKIYTNCGFGSCEHRGTAHHHPFLDEGDTTGFPAGGWNEEHDKPINYRLAASPTHPAAVGRNANLEVGLQEGKVLQFKPRRE